MLDEARIIQQLKSAFPEAIGDDAAVIHSTSTELTLISKDLLIEHIHFNRRYISPQDLAYKCLQVNLSDIAAMGGTPTKVLLGIAIPPNYASELPTFITRFTESCQQAGITLIGGDTTRSTQDLCISITILGTVDPTQITYRHTAQPSNYFCVIGNLGYAHVGLQALESNTHCDERYTKALCRPQALITEAAWLAQQPGITAMMDISDGLTIDLSRLCEASKVSAHLNIEHLPQDLHFEQACQSLQLDPVMTQLCGGEDYGLLCTLDASQYPQISAEFRKKFTTPLLCLGQLQTKHPSCIQYFQHGTPISLTPKPFSHFGEL